MAKVATTSGYVGEDHIERYSNETDSHLEFQNGKPFIKNIPKKSTICIVSLPSRREVVSTPVSGSYTPSQLDPGKYAYTIQKTPLYNNPHRAWSHRGEFLVDVNEQEYQRLLHMKPRFSKSVSTSQGARWDCGIENCTESFTSIIAVLQHEGEHTGVDYLHASIDEIEEAIVSSEVKPKEPPSTVRNLKQESVLTQKG